MSKFLDSTGVGYVLGLIKSTFKPKQTAQTTDPAADGSGITFVDSVKQDANGVNTVHRKTVQNASGSQAGLMSSADYTKLSGIEAGAQVHIAPTTAEVKNALGTGSGTTKFLREDGSWQTPNYPVTSVAGKTGAVTLVKSDVGLGNVTNDAQVKRSEMGVANGVATLDENGQVPASQLPSYVDDVIEMLDMTNTAPATCAKGDVYYNTTSKKLFTATGTNTWGTTGKTPEGGKIYTNLSTGKEYRWGGSDMSVISDTIAIGTTTGTALDGKVGSDHINDKNNPHSVTKTQVGLGNVTNDAQVKRTEMGAASGVATLDANTKIPVSQLPTVSASSGGTGGSAGAMTPAQAEKLNGIEAGAQAHIAPTASEVKSALGTGTNDGTFLRKDGTWAEPVALTNAEIDALWAAAS